MPAHGRGLANITAAVGGGGDAPALAGTGKDDVHLLVVCTAERGLCGGFNSRSSSGPRDGAQAPERRQDGEDHHVGKKGYDILRRDYANLIIDRVESARSEADRLRQCPCDRRKGDRPVFEAGEFDVCTLFYSEFKSVISADPDRAADHPGRRAKAKRRERARRLRIRAGAGRSWPTFCRATSRCRFSAALLENAAGEMGAKMSAMDNATRNAGDMINKLTITYNRQRQAQITKELIEIISGAEAL
jgi:F-type H+-transporting ATPase subunit gamma